MLSITTNHAITYTNLGKSIAQVCLKSTSALSDHFSKQASGVEACPERDLRTASLQKNQNTRTTVSLFSLACVRSEIHNLQRIFRRVQDTKGGHCARRSLWRPWKLGIRIIASSKPRMCCEESLGKIKFRAFPECVGPRILSLESVDYFGTSDHY